MYMKKYVLDLRVTSVECLGDRFLLLVTTNPDGPLPEMAPGQFAQLRIDDSKDTFLRRPISLHSFDFLCRRRGRALLRFGRSVPARR